MAAELVHSCPRCGAEQITFDVLGAVPILIRYNWQTVFEAFCCCRRCRRSTVFVLVPANVVDQQAIDKFGLLDVGPALDNICNVEGFISTKDEEVEDPPEHLPQNIEQAFREGATCLAVKCFNAAGTMFRLCLDFATRSMLPGPDEEQPNKRVKYSLGHRLEWLFDNGRLPAALRDLSDCVKEDGNDGAHEGTLSEADAEDLHDFTVTLLTRLYTEPAQLEEAKARREARRAEARKS
jgi:hypothetical protein